MLLTTYPFFRSWLMIAVLIIGAPTGTSQSAPPRDDLAEAAAEPDRNPIPTQLLKGYFARPPQSYLLDPQRQLSQPERRAREDFLQYHSSDSKIDLHVMLFKSDQSLPADIRIEELGERFFGTDKPSLLVLYFYGEPERSVLEFSPDLRTKINAWQGQRILRDAIRDATEAAAASTQLEKFCTQLSIRLSMLEGKLNFADGSQPGAEPSTRSTSFEAPKTAPSGDPLSHQLRSIWHTWWLPISLTVATLVIGWLTTTILARRRRYLAPQVAISPRLGCPHAAGVGAKISFSPATRSPSGQSSTSRDSLGGL